MGTDKTEQGILWHLPPFCWAPNAFLATTDLRRLALLHIRIFAGLYGAVFFTAFAEKALYVKGGIGIFQNPPFFAHMLGGALSLLITIKITKNLDAIRYHGGNIDLFQGVANSRFRYLSFNICAFIAILSFSYNLVMSASYAIKIYDSTYFPFVLTVYSIVRFYVYFLYAVMVSAVVSAIYYVSNSLKTSQIAFTPFHKDGVGGLRRYFSAIDTPMYFLQSIAAAIAIANYIGWGGFSFTPALLATAVLLVISILAFAHFFSFRHAVKTKLEVEIRKLREKQASIYQNIALKDCEPSRTKEFVEELEATDRLISLINRKPEKGWVKYIANLAPVVVANLDKLYGGHILAFLKATVTSGHS